MDTSKLSDPKILGPGEWFLMHAEAAHLMSEKSELEFEERIRKICKWQRCSVCRTHFQKYIDEHPFAPYRNRFEPKSGRRWGHFIWLYEMHNEVNKYLRKHQPKLEEAWNYYSNLESEEGICFDCGVDTTTTTTSSVSKSTKEEHIFPVKDTTVITHKATRLKDISKSSSPKPSLIKRVDSPSIRPRALVSVPISAEEKPKTTKLPFTLVPKRR